MAKIMMSAETGEKDAYEYEKWAGKLMDVYTKEAEKITDSYMGSVSL
jgi:hypothetical protein